MSISILVFGCKKTNNVDLKARNSPEWIKGAVICQVDINTSTNEGTFKALTSEISGIKQTGISIVSIRPIYAISEMRQKGERENPYIVKDFYELNPILGNPDEFKSLVNSFHDQNVKIIIDFPAGFTAWDSKLLFEHPDWFKHDGEGAIISPDLNLPDAAQLDYDQHELKKYMIAVMSYWIKDFNIDGFNCIGSKYVPLDFWNIVRNELEKIRPIIMVSDFASPEYHYRAFDLTPSWDINLTVHSIFNHTSTASIIDDSMKYESTSFPEGSMHLRIVKNYLKGNDQDSTGLTAGESKIADFLKFTLPGVPVIDDYKKSANFTNNTMQSASVISRSQRNRYDEFYSQLCTLHREHPSLTIGSFEIFPNSENSSAFSFLRFASNDSIIAVINFEKARKDINLKLPADSMRTWKDLISGNIYRTKDFSVKLTLPPLGFALLATDIERIVK